MKNIFIGLVFVILPFVVSAQVDQPILLQNDKIRVEWVDHGDGYNVSALQVRRSEDWYAMPPARCQYNVLYSAAEPDAAALTLYDSNGKALIIPESEYRYITPSWQQNTSAVAMNVAGENIVYRPSSVVRVSDREVTFSYDSPLMRINQTWSLCDDYSSDIKVAVKLFAKRDGYYSIASVSLTSIDKHRFSWATIPGVFQGNSINNDFVQAFGYGQGIPNKPIVVRERTAATLSSIITDANGVTVAVTAEPGTGRDPWLYDKKTHAQWQLGLSVMNRDGEFTPTLYHPILGEQGSFAAKGDSLSFSFRYTVHDADWYATLKHVVNDVYLLPGFLKLKKTDRSLAARLYDMHEYLVSDSTSKWRVCDYKGLSIGAQDYLGGVHGSEKDAMKNSDYGAMWMLARMTGDERLIKTRLPYALDFKLAQQFDAQGFFYGAAAGQYYLHKSKQFAEEWGPYTEPIATTYYMLMDMGNVLLFEPQHKGLEVQLTLAADKLLEWMNPEGRWEIAYDNRNGKPMFEDIQDLRPTFYGLVIAYRITGNKKYLRGAVKGADWYVKNGIEKGHFLGVCGDTRFVPDFATAQSVQALLDLYDLTKNEKYKSAALMTARIYTASIYTHPIPTTVIKMAKGIARADWQISQVGLSFEHGGTMGSANHRGPILLASHAGMFVRMYAMTGDSLFLTMARTGVIGRDAFVDNSSGVASYYWDSMNGGPGPFPHHAWWQIGWITDYLVAEAEMRSAGKIMFPKGFITPKVGPHRTYGFAQGSVYGAKVDLIMRRGLVGLENPYVEYLTAYNGTAKELYLVVMNNDDQNQQCDVGIDLGKLTVGKKKSITSVTVIDRLGGKTQGDNSERLSVSLEPYGLSVIKIKYR